MTNIFWDKFGLMGGSAWTGEFWHTPVGFGSIVVILLCSLHNIFSKCIDDDLFDRVYYWGCVFACSAAVWCIYDERPTYNLVKVLTIGLAVRFLVSVIQRRIRYHKSGKPQKTFGMQ